jgi:hypothetical protein
MDIEVSRSVVFFCSGVYLISVRAIELVDSSMFYSAAARFMASISGLEKPL